MKILLPVKYFKVKYLVVANHGYVKAYKLAPCFSCGTSTHLRVDIKPVNVVNPTINLVLDPKLSRTQKLAVKAKAKYFHHRPVCLKPDCRKKHERELADKLK